MSLPIKVKNTVQKDLVINMKEWHYLKGVDSIGPIDSEEIISLIHSKTITRDSLVWKQSMGEWKKACETEFLSSFLLPPPPPISRVISNKTENTIKYVSGNIPNRKCAKCGGVLKYTHARNTYRGSLKDLHYSCDKCYASIAFNGFGHTVFNMVATLFFFILTIASIFGNGGGVGSFLIFATFFVGYIFVLYYEFNKSRKNPIT